MLFFINLYFFCDTPKTERDIKFIDEFFSMKKPVRNYQNVSEKSKNILCKELSYIGEVDSELTISKIKFTHLIK